MNHISLAMILSTREYFFLWLCKVGVRVFYWCTIILFCMHITALFSQWWRRVSTIIIFLKLIDYIWYNKYSQTFHLKYSLNIYPLRIHTFTNEFLNSPLLVPWQETNVLSSAGNLMWFLYCWLFDFLIPRWYYISCV